MSTAPYVRQGFALMAGLLVATGASGQEITLARTWLDKDSPGVWCMAFSPDSKTLATGTLKAVDLWDVATAKKTAKLEHLHNVYCLAFDTEGKKLASGENGLIHLWDTNTGKKITTLDEAHRGFVYSIAFSPNGKLLASAGEDQTVKMWSVDTGKAAFIIKGQSFLRGIDDGQQQFVAFSPDGKKLASAGNVADLDGNEIKFWDCLSGRNVARWKSEPASFLAFASEKTLISAPALAHWELATGKRISHFPDAGGIPLGLSPGGKTLAISAGRQSHLVDVATGKKFTTLKGHINAINAVAFSPDGRKIASACQVIKLWNVTGKAEKSQDK